MGIMVVTGSASGIGKALAAILRERGHRVIGVDLADAEVEVDLATPAGARDMADRVLALCGGSIDGVAACAGLLAPDRPVKVVETNFFAARDTLALLKPLLAKASEPRAVAISSLAITLPHDARTTQACLAGDREGALQAAADEPDLAYQSAKAALSLWVRRAAVAEDWAGSGIVLNAVAPGTTQTPMIKAQLDDPVSREIWEEAAPSALGRVAQPEEVAELIAFLLSPANSIMIGQTVLCDMGADATRRPGHI